MVKGNFKWEVGGKKTGLELRRRAGLESLAWQEAMLEQAVQRVGVNEDAIASILEVGL